LVEVVVVEAIVEDVGTNNAEFVPTPSLELDSSTT
jgi:hypothetical protein